MGLESDFFKILDNFSGMIVDFAQQLGIFGAMGMAYLEALMTFLPLVVIAGANISNYGLMGLIYTYIGSSLGMISVFYFIRKFFTNRFQNSNFMKKNKIIKKYIHWVENKGLTSVIVLMCFPFIPSSFLNYSCALSKMSTKEFMIIVLVSRFFSISFLSYFGSSLLDFYNKPFHAIIAAMLMVAMYLISKIVDKKINEDV